MMQFYSDRCWFTVASNGSAGSGIRSASCLAFLSAATDL